jgi:predicted ATP-dependent endonuclease of OLD family
MMLQIVFTTHSPYMVDWNLLAAGTKLYRVCKGSDGCRAHALRAETVRDVVGLLENRSNPHVLGTIANEVFFVPERVILVEGQDDVVLYPRMAMEVGIELPASFFGWGVGGADNMGKIAAVLSDLGFEKVMGVLDADKQPLAAELTKDFPDYTFRCIPAADVRDKDAVKPKPAVEGLCDTKGRIHTERKKDVEDLFRDIGKYFGGP